MTQSTVRTRMLAGQIQAGVALLHSLMAEMTSKLAHQQPAGTANSIAATLGHLLTSTDGVVNGMIKGGAPLFTSMPTGLSQMPPGGADTFNWYEWGTKVEVDLAVAKKYGDAVFASVNDFLNSINDSDLDDVLQTPNGERTKLDMLNIVVLGGLNQHGGEISALKGIYGSLKGFPL